MREPLLFYYCTFALLLFCSEIKINDDLNFSFVTIDKFMAISYFSIKYY